MKSPTQRSGHEKSRRRLNRTSPRPLALEPRLMFDGAAIDTAAAIADSGASHAAADNTAAAVDKTITANTPVATATAAPVDVQKISVAQADVAPAAGFDLHTVSGPRVLTNGDPAADGGRHEIAFIDSSINGWTQLAQSVGPGIEVVLIDSSSDGLKQMADYLEGRTGIDAIHVMAHGEEGEATFGSLHLTTDNIAQHQTDLARIGASLSTQGDVLLYGCDVAKGSDGLSFIGKIAEATGADVAASSNSTGSASLGGDWVLEARTGSVEVRSFDLSNAPMPDFLLGSPVVTSVDDTTYTEGSGAMVIDNNITVTGGTSYDGQYVRFSLTNGQTTDTLGLNSAGNVNTSGAISLSGSSVYLGNGSGRDVIGTVDSTENGLNGQALKINFVSTFTNSSFESGLTGWTVMNQRIDLGVTSIAGFVSPNDPTNPSQAPNKDNNNPATLGTLATVTDTSQHTDGNQSAHLSSTNMTTAAGYDVVHGPAIYSDIFSATTGDAIYFDWRALAGSDAYDVYGYLLNTTTGAATQVLNATGSSSSGTTNWATASTTIPTSGNYRFVFVSGTFDFSGGRAAGASLYIDNVRVYGSKVNDTVVSNIARQVTFASSADNAVTSPTRIFNVTAVSATNTSGSDTGLINITAVNDAPTLTGTAQVLNYTENALATPIDTAIVVADPDSPANFNGGYVQAQVTTNGAIEDQLSVLNQGTAAGQIGVSGTNITYGGTVIGVIDATLNGVNDVALKVALNGNATVAATQALMRAISYRDTSDNPSTAARTVTFTLNDGGNTGTGSALSGTRTATINVAAVDDPAVMTLSATSENYTENDNSYFVDANLTITDVDSTTMNGARVVIAAGFKGSEDLLSPATGTNADGITYSYSSATGVLTLSGSATIAQYQAALRAVKYSNSSDNPDTTPRTITFTLGNTVALTIGGVNHYYEVVSGALSWTAARTAAESRTFQGLTGYLATITSQVEDDFIRQKLTADAWIGASDDYTYINAATGTTTYANQAAAEGHWYWVTGPEKGTRISDGNGSPVTFTGSYAYWNSGEPNNSGGTEHYGEIYSSGAAGKWNDLPNTSTLTYVVEYSDTGGTPTFSKSIAVTPVRVNDAPVTSGIVSMTSINEDATSNSGQLISSFLSATDPDTAPVTGVAVTGLSASHGTWQYSIDNGASWSNVGAVATNSALLLRSTDRVRFIPDGQNSDSASLTYRAWDRTDENGTSIAAGVKVNATTNGGITPYSSGTQTANLTVTALNDAPTLSATGPALTTIDENAIANGGQMISSIVGATIGDVDTGASKGIAVTALNSGNGTWEYSTNGGSSWTAVGTVALNSALLLRDTDLIRFHPDGNNGTSANFTYKAWDRTSGTQGNKVDATTGGGTTAFSTTNDTASITVTSINDAPVLSGAALTLASITEKNTTNSGQTVASVLGTTLTDVDAGAVGGIAITASTVAGSGVWEYSTDGGSTWTAMGSVSASSALLLRATDRIRFNPDAYLGGTATLTVRGWDTTTGTVGTTADTTTNGGSTAFSITTATASINVTNINDAPVITTAAADSSFTEGASAQNVGSGLVLIDDGTNLSSATVRIKTGFTSGDVLAVGTPGGLTASYNSATGVLTLSGTASVATYQTALRSITFISSSEDPTVNSATRTLEWSATDSTHLTSSASNSTLTVIATADAPTSSGAPVTWSYTEDDGTRIVAPTLSLADVDDTQLSGATVSISGVGYLNDGYELLAAMTTGTAITANFDGSIGTLTLSGTDSVANYQKVLRSVTYTNTRDYNNPSAIPSNDFTLDGSSNTRTFAWQVTDANSDGANGSPTFGAQSSSIANTTVTLYNANEVPQVTDVDGNITHIQYTEGGAAATLEGLLTVHDDGLVSSINSAFVRVTAGLAEGDQLGFFTAIPGWTQSGTATSGTLDNGAGTIIAYNWSLASGDMTLTTIGGSADQSDYTTIMQRVGFVSTSDDPTASNATRTLIWRVTDSGGLQSAVTTAQSTIIDVTAVDDASTISNLPANGDVIFTEKSSDVAVAPSLALADPDDTQVGSASVNLSGTGFIASVEYLGLPGVSVTPGSDWSASNVNGSGIDAHYDWVSGTLTLSASGGVDLGAMQNLLRQVTYGSIDNNPTVVDNTRTLTWTVTDMFGSRITDVPGSNDGDPGVASSPITSTITIAPRNDAPLLNGLNGTASYTEGGSAVTLAGAMSLSDSDDANLSQAQVWISAGFTTGDALTVTAPGGLTTSYDSSTGILTLSGVASKATYRTALRSIHYASTSNDPTAIAPDRTISWTLTDANASGDGALTSSVGNSHIDLTATDNAAYVGGMPAAGSITYHEGGSGVAIAPGGTVGDTDDTTMSGLTVTITAGKTAGDSLSVTADLTSTGIAVTSYDAATGTLVLGGTATLADYQTALRSIVFSSSSDDPTGTSATRTFAWSTVSTFASRLSDSDGSNDASAGLTSAIAATGQISLTAANDAPTITFDDGTSADPTDAPLFQQGGSPLYVVKATIPNIAGGVTAADVDDTQLAGASVQITDSFSSNDVLSIAAPPGWSKAGNIYSIGGDNITVTYNGATGMLTLSGAASKANYSTLLGYVQYQNASASPTDTGASRELTWTITDANSAGDGARSVAGKTYLVIRDVNDAPQIAPSSSTVNYTEGAASVALPDIVVSDPDPGEIVTATLTLSSTSAGELTIPVGASYDPGTGVWTMTGTVADVNTALAAVAFVPLADNDVNATITINIADGGEDGASAAVGVINLNVTAVNDAPVLTPANPVLATINEDAVTNSGYQVGSFRGSVTDVDTGATAGIAITSLNSGNGTWQFSTDGGSSWSSVGSVSSNNALLLRDADFIRFLPDGQNASTPSFDYRAWDRSSGTQGTRVDASTTGNSAAFSSASDTATLTVSAVNDAPVLASGDTTLPSITEDDVNNGGELISTLLAGKVTDVDAGAVEGIAVTNLSSGNGAWQYSLDAGTTWTAVNNASTNSALLLRDTDLIRFVPDSHNTTSASFAYRAWDRSTGSAGNTADVSAAGTGSAYSTVQNTVSLSATAVNDAPMLAAATPVLTTLTEDDLSNVGQTVASIVAATISDVDNGAQQGIALTSLANGNGTWQFSIDGGSNWSNVGTVSNSGALLLRDNDKVRFVPDGQNATNAGFTYRAWDQSSGAAGSTANVIASGGTTAFSSDENSASIAVSAVNDAPVLAADAPVLASLSEDDTSNGGTQIAALLGTTVTDVDSIAPHGIAITDLNSGNGSWQFSIDGGTTWVNTGEVSTGSALQLRDTDYIRFLPDSKNATNASFSYKAWDQSSGTSGTRADVTVSGGTTAFSTHSNTASITVTPVNDAPINDVTPTIEGDARSDGTLRQDGVLTADPQLWHDVDQGDPAVVFHYQWQIADDASGTNLRDITGATAIDYTVPASQIGQYVRVRITGSDGQAETIAYSDYREVTNHAPISNLSLATQETTQSVPIRFTLPSNAFVDADKEDTLYYSATLADGSPLPAWLTFDANTRTFSGTPGGADIGVLRLRVIAIDHGQSVATSDFSLRVLALPLNPAGDGNAVPGVAPPLAPSTEPSTPVAHTDSSFFQQPDTQLFSASSTESANTTRDATTSLHGDSNSFAEAQSFVPHTTNGADNLLAGGLTRPEGFRVVVEPSRSNDISLLLMRPLNDQISRPDETIRLSVPIDTFVHTQRDAVITLLATRTDGTPLPSWLHFDAAKGQFHGAPPVSFDGDIEVVVIARDNFGNEASTTFRFRIHRKLDKLSFNGKQGLSFAVRAEAQSRIPTTHNAALQIHTLRRMLG